MTLLRYGSQLEEIAAAEQGDGWLSACERDGRFLIPTEQFVEALGQFLRRLEAGPVLEVCAGGGELAAALRATGVPVAATDADPPSGAAVVRASAEEALRRYRPVVVLGCFVPVGAGVDPLVLGFPSVRHYVVLGARVGGVLGSPLLWRHPSWTAEPIEPLTRWMLTRHDAWIDRQTILRCGEAWHLRHRSVLAGCGACTTQDGKSCSSTVRDPPPTQAVA